MTTNNAWRKEMLDTLILYRLKFGNEKIPVDTTRTNYAFIERDLNELFNADFIAMSSDDQYWQTASKGEEVLSKLRAMIAHAQAFEIFSDVDPFNEQPEESMHLAHVGQVRDDLFDFRFKNQLSPESEDFWDLRIAMMSHLAKMSGQEFDPHRLVFVQKMMDGEFNSPPDQFWADLKLGKFFQEVEEVVTGAAKAEQLFKPEEVREVMDGIYTAGMLEAQKRAGDQCGNDDCGAALALYEQRAKQRGRTLDECPICGRDFTAVVDDDYQRDDRDDDSEEELVIVSTYAYDPFFYDPWDPYVASGVLVTGFCVGAILF